MLPKKEVEAVVHALKTDEALYTSAKSAIAGSLYYAYNDDPALDQLPDTAVFRICDKGAEQILGWFMGTRSATGEARP